jgi:hypothetical protein
MIAASSISLPLSKTMKFEYKANLSYYLRKDEENSHKVDGG